MDEDYKGHHIQSVPRNLLPDSERWTAQVLINWTDGPRKQFSGSILSAALQPKKMLSGKGSHSQRSGSMSHVLDLPSVDARPIATGLHLLSKYFSDARLAKQLFERTPAPSLKELRKADQKLAGMKAWTKSGED